METHIFEAKEFIDLLGLVTRVVLPPGGTDTCTPRGEDHQYSGNSHSISEIVLLDD
jgi:hypothetical protein